MKKFFAITAMLVLLGAGCTGRQSASAPVAVAPAEPTSTIITYYLSTDDRGKFCNGGDMDSNGYKRTLTKKVITSVSGVLSLEDKIKTTLIMAASDPHEFGAGNPYPRAASTTFENGVVTLYPASGWAGSSIFACAWTPFVEKQLEQFPEVKKIEWKDVIN